MLYKVINHSLVGSKPSTRML